MEEVKSVSVLKRENQQQPLETAGKTRCRRVAQRATDTVHQ